MYFLGGVGKHPLPQWDDVFIRLSKPLACSLPVRETHVWQAAILLPAPVRQDLLAMLSKEERARAILFAFNADQERFIASHGLLRLILAAYTKQRPEAIGFVLNRYGKPQLASTNGVPIYFNMSHSGDRVLVSISSVGAVGIDVERLVPDYPWEEIVRQFFSFQEQEYLYSLLPERQTEEFFTIWTSKEAYWKATGIGLSGLDIDQTGSLAQESIRLRQFRLDEEYLGAVAIDRDASVIRCFRLQLAL